MAAPSTPLPASRPTLGGALTALVVLWAALAVVPPLLVRAGLPVRLGLWLAPAGFALATAWWAATWRSAARHEPAAARPALAGALLHAAAAITHAWTANLF